MKGEKMGNERRFVIGDEFIEFKEDAEYTLILAYAKVCYPDYRDPDWDPYYRSRETFRDASIAWEECRRRAEMVGSSNLVCASLRRNFETVAMRAVKGA